ncbi:MAG: L-threonylcarbamoyladenylate synthase [Candidatus Zixiibacteriota bacterium]
MHAKTCLRGKWAGEIVSFNRRRPSPGLVARLGDRLLHGGIVIAPTETRYALLADATSAPAVQAVREIKGRSRMLPFSVFVLDVSWCHAWGMRLNTVARHLAGEFWPGPMTLILPVRDFRFALPGGRRGTIGIRVTPEPIVKRLLALMGRPLIATSANPSGRILSCREENRWLSGLVARWGVIWARPRRYVRRDASTVVDCAAAGARQLRAGPISPEQWMMAAGRGNRGE